MVGRMLMGLAAVIGLLAGAPGCRGMWFGASGPGMSSALQDSLEANYLVEWTNRTGSEEGCDSDAIRLTHQGELELGYHDYVVEGCGDLSWRVFTKCQNQDMCLDMFNVLTLERSARFDLECKEEELVYRVLGGKAFGVEGCGRKATYIAGADAWQLDSGVSASRGSERVVADKAPAAAKPELQAAAAQGSAHGFVVGIGRYRDLPAPKGARADAESVAEMMRVTLGITGERLRVALDDRATAADIKRGLKWLAETTPSGGRAYFYFSGHGAPAPANGSTYLVPFDGDPLALDDSALALDGVLASLGAGKAKDTVAMIDSCFSGSGGRSVLPEGTRPLARVREPEAPTNLVVLTASSGAEISGARADGKLGLFTSYLLQGVGKGRADIDGDAQITVEELVEWVGPRVSRDAKKVGRQQTPKVLGSVDHGQVVLVHGLRGGS
jgi:Caspase domain